MALDLGGNKKKPNDKSKYSIVELSLFKPGKKKYSEFDYEEIRKKQLKEDDSSGDDERFHDREALEIVKRLEAKYGGKKNKKGRKLCFGTEDDYMDKRAGYDLEDDFIDDSEAYDELIPSTMDTVQGGFYVNRGKLEFKTKHDEVNDSDISDADDAQPHKKGTKRPQISSDDDVEVVEDPAVAPTSSTSVAKTISEPPAPVPAAPKPRMVGAPPTKVRRMTLGESPNQRAANAIKKRLVGMPPTLLKRKVLQTAVARKENEMSDFLRTMAGGPIPSPEDDLELIASTSTLPPAPPKNKTPEKASVDAAATPATSDAPFPEFVPQNNSAPSSAEASSSTAAVPPSPKKRPLAPMTDTLSSMIEEFKRCTNNLALPGQKKRLQNIHVDMVIAIEEQCLKDGYSVHEKARVAHSLADYCGIQKNSLYARCIKRRDEHKNGAPNLAFLAKSGGTFSNNTAPTTAFNKTTPSPVAAPITNKATSSTTTPVPTPSKSTPAPATATVAPSSSKSISVQPPATVATPSTVSSVPKTSAPSAVSTASTSAPVHTSVTSTTATSSKTSQPWTNQKKLAAQAMITNVAGLPSFSGRVGELQEVLKKVATESITYEDFLKWHDMSMKPASKQSSEHKSVNGVAKQVPSTSTSNKTASHGTDSINETSSVTQSKNPPTTLEPTKRVTLAQAVAASKLPPRMRPMTIPSAQISEKFETEKQTTIRAVTTAVENSKVTHKKKCEAALAAGKPPPRFDFLWTENLARALRSQMDLYWSVLLSSDTYAKAADGIVTIFSKEILPYFKGEIKLSRLLVEYTRRNPDKAFILACPSVQKLMKDEGVDLNNITIITKKEKTSSDAVAPKVNSSRPYKPILPVRSSSSDEIQVIAIKTAASPSSCIPSKNPFTPRNLQK